MKFEEGDKIIVLLTEEEGKVVEIMNEKMVMIEVKGVRFPTYTDQIDFPYFKMFSKKRVEEKQKVFIDNVKSEKGSTKQKVADGMFVSFVPVFSKDVFDDQIIEKFKLYLINQTDIEFNFTYDLVFNGVSDFELHNSITPLNDFYLNDVKFEELSDNPRFEFEFSLKKPDKRKAEYFEASLKIKAKQLFKRIEEMQLKNEPSFSYLLFQEYPDKVEEVKVDLSRLGNSGYRIYSAHEIRQNMPAPQSVVDLHIEKLTDNWKHLSNFEILTIQLKAFEKHYDAAIAHYQPNMIVIHGIGAGKLRDEIHEILKGKGQVKSFRNQYHPNYGYGATEIFFEY
ncbi:Smr/MutS family protein [Ferruginibacter sp. SUN002]|uniref:Smr/MutS family protein n=1 Tax=Ferruginibacter sp. SUN002 TaxID=2937789 RepID=UPI003D362113